MDNRLAARRRRLRKKSLIAILSAAPIADDHPIGLVDMTNGTPRTIARMKTRRDAVVAASQLLETGHYGMVYVVDSRPGGRSSKHWRPGWSAPGVVQ